MAYQDLDKSISMVASGALAQFVGVVTDSNGQAALPTLGAQITGVMRNATTAAGQAASVAVQGVVKGVAAAAIAAGAAVTVTAAGKFQTATTGQFIAGIAQRAAAGANEVIPILLQTGGKV